MKKRFINICINKYFINVYINKWYKSRKHKGRKSKKGIKSG